MASTAKKKGFEEAKSSRPIGLAQVPLAESVARQRAFEAVLWGMPAVNCELMLQAAMKAKAEVNQVVYWPRVQSWKIQTLTPNPDTVYFSPFISTKVSGPMVLEIPSASDEGSLTGTIMDLWQCALEDVGPQGFDQGKGGKYLILPPGHQDLVPEGFIPLRAKTYAGYAILRSIPRSGSDADVAQAVAYGKKIKLYPLSRAASPSETVFVDVADVVFDSTIPYDVRYFESLHRIVQAEPWLERDKAMIDHLKTIGIEKGKPFRPDQSTRGVLDQAAREAHEWLVAKYEAFFSRPFYPQSHWVIPASPEIIEGQANSFSKPDVYPIDDRALLYSYIYFSPKRLGTGSYYLMTIADSKGELLDGAKSYRLKVPKDAPVRQYWSATVYDRYTHALVRGVKRPSRSSAAPDLQVNADGSVDIYFGPTAPPGRDANWIPTNQDGGFEVLFRFYEPSKALFEKSWALPDLEEVSHDFR